MANIYVKQVHGGTSSGTLANPYKTLSEANTNASPGATIIVIPTYTDGVPDVYDENLTISKSATSWYFNGAVVEPTTGIGINITGSAVFIDGAVVLSPNAAGVQSQNINGHYLRNSYLEGTNGVYFILSSGHTIENCTLKGTSSNSLYLNSASGVTVRNCTCVTDNPSVANMSMGSTNNIVADTVMIGGTYGVTFSTNCKITRSLCFGVTTALYTGTLPVLDENNITNTVDPEVVDASMRNYMGTASAILAGQPLATGGARWGATYVSTAGTRDNRRGSNQRSIGKMTDGSVKYLTVMASDMDGVYTETNVDYDVDTERIILTAASGNIETPSTSPIDIGSSANSYLWVQDHSIEQLNQGANSNGVVSFSDANEEGSYRYSTGAASPLATDPTTEANFGEKISATNQYARIELTLSKTGA